MPVHDWSGVIAGTFHHFHHEWISAISRVLNAGLLPPDYYAMAEQVTGGLGPDVLALGSPHFDDGEVTGDDYAPDGSGGLATQVPAVRFTAEMEIELYTQRKGRVAIRHRSGDDVIAVIEIVSPGNKSSRRGLQSFVSKVHEFLDAGIHLLIIDILPPGNRDPQGIHAAVWDDISETDDTFTLPDGEPLTMVAYTGGFQRQAFIEPVAIGNPLPDMPLFLKPPGHVMVPLESTYLTAFEGVPQRWRREIQRLSKA